MTTFTPEHIVVSEAVAAQVPLFYIMSQASDALQRPRNQIAEIHFYHERTGKYPTIAVAIVANIVSVLTESEAIAMKAELQRIKEEVRPSC